MFPLSNMIDANSRMVSPLRIKKFIWSLITNLQPMEAGYDLSSMGDIIVYDLFLMAKILKLNLEVHVK